MIYPHLPHKNRTQAMANERFSSLHREGEDPRSKLYWLDIDASFDDITRQQQIIPSRIAHQPLSSLQYSVLHGVGTVANALSVGDKAATFDRFQVDVAALAPGLPEAHRSARMIWNEMDFRSPRLEIRVQAKMLRHLVELYVTKRIDTVIMSMKIAVERRTIIDASADSELLPILDQDGRLYFPAHAVRIVVGSRFPRPRARSDPALTLACGRDR